MAAAQYGANVWGSSERELFGMQSQALASMTPTAQGRSRAFTLLMSGDPTWRPAVEPLLQWATV
eukprot:1658996-Alexandrium_andersonii.AAC.1